MSTGSATENGSLQAKAFDLSSTGQPMKQRGFFVAQRVLRVLAIAFSVVAISVMVTAKETTYLFTIRIEGRYSFTASYRFLLAVDAILCGFSVLSMIFVWFQSHQEFNSRTYFFLLLHDMVMMLLMMSGCAAATATGYVARYGEPKLYWMAVCNAAHKLCNTLTFSLVFSYLIFFCYLALNVMGAYKLMSPPTKE
ncbi:hypothetical protein Tsubulata_015122 [Turnera subulata]|uniref:CASP-like protein n=1 Tax=Turnera subulata TaxID=218843 RepID=A0A9Q0F238_9ROSI|nr:hypothetical protein Tsubulata_015122 [Turnera subulata]